MAARVDQVPTPANEPPDSSLGSPCWGYTIISLIEIHHSVEGLFSACFERAAKKVKRKERKSWAERTPSPPHWVMWPRVMVKSSHLKFNKYSGLWINKTHAGKKKKKENRSSAWVWEVVKKRSCFVLWSFLPSGIVHCTELMSAFRQEQFWISVKKRKRKKVFYHCILQRLPGVLAERGKQQQLNQGANELQRRISLLTWSVPILRTFEFVLSKPCTLHEVHHLNPHRNNRIGLDEWRSPTRAHLYGVLLQVEVSCVNRYALGDLLQVLSGADDSAGLVGTGAEGGAGGGSYELLPREEEEPQ